MRLGVENRKNGDLGVQFSRREEGVMVKEKWLKPVWSFKKND